MLRYRRSLILAAAAACAVAAPAPAQAQNADVAASASLHDGTAVTRTAVNDLFSVASSTLDTINSTTLNQSGTAKVFAHDEDGSIHVAVSCTASGLGASGIGILECFLRPTDPGRGDERYDALDEDALPGVADATAGTVHVPGGEYEVCVKTRALLREGAQFVETPLVCS